MKKIFTAILALSISLQALAQVGSVSPYSRYGIGDMQFHGTVSQLGLGGCGIALLDSVQLNFTNPAMYPALRITLFDAGLNASIARFSTATKFTNKTDAAFSYFALGFPIKRGGGAGVALGLLPYSTRGYSLSYNELNPEGIKVTHSFEGSGGLNRFFIGSGFKLLPNLNIGAHASYLFGTLTKQRRTEFADNSFLFSRNTINTSIADFLFDAGIYYRTDSLLSFITNKLDPKNPGTPAKPNYITKRKHLRLATAATVTFARNLRDKNDYVTENYYTDPIGTIYIVDTSYYIPTLAGKTSLPALYKFAFAIQDINHITYTAEYHIQDWRTFKSFGITDSLRNSFTIATGFELIPKYNSLHYAQRIAYRIGMRYHSSMLSLRNTPITDYTVSLGVGLPIKRDAVTAAYGTSLSRLNIALELGMRGTTTNQLLQEQYIRLHIGVSLSELWFIQRKYD